MNRRLTEKQKKFCDYYIETGVATEAYKKAGYKNYKSSGVEASKTLNNPSVRAYIDTRLKQIESDRIAKPEEIMQYLTKVMRGEEKDQFGLDAPLTERTKCAELLGKRYMMFKEKVSVDSNVGVTIIDDIPTEDDKK